MSLHKLPNALLQLIMVKMVSEKDMNAFVCTSPVLYQACNDYFYRHNVKKFEGRAIVQAAEHNEIESVKRFLKSGSDTVVRTMLERGFIRCTLHTTTPLCVASYNGHIEIVELLLHYGAKVNSPCQRYNNTPLAWAAKGGHQAIAKLLIAHGADVNYRGNNLQTPLMQAAQHGHASIIHLLLASGAKLDAMDLTHRTTLFFAARNGHSAIVKDIIDRKDNALYTLSIAGRSTLDAAGDARHMNVLEVFTKDPALQAWAMRNSPWSPEQLPSKYASQTTCHYCDTSLAETENRNVTIGDSRDCDYLACVECTARMPRGTILNVFPTPSWLEWV